MNRDISSIDWETLKHEFVVNNDFKEARTWLRAVHGWSEQRLNNGNTRLKTVGWSTERAQIQHKLRESAMESLKEAEKLLAIDLLNAKITSLKSLIARIDRSTVREAISILKVIKTELGEPTAITAANASFKDTDLIDQAMDELSSIVANR